jgi:DNA-binding NtrC family response regulator
MLVHWGARRSRATRSIDRQLPRLYHASMEAAPFPAHPVLIVDDDLMVLEIVRELLSANGIGNVIACHDSREAVGLLARHRCSVVLLDIRMPGLSGLELLPALQAESPETIIVVLTGLDEVDVAVQCMKAGAFDFIQKPVESVRLLTSVRNAIERWEEREENQRLRESVFAPTPRYPAAFAAFVTRSPAMGAIFRYVEAIAPTSLPVLVTGETGVGKELLARAIHDLSGRTGDFVAVNVGGLDDALFSDALFGHRRGSFTGAAEPREGMVAAAARGTLFLDEIGDLHPESQVKLLRLLQEREYRPLGADQPVATDARFIFATNRDLDAEASAGRFRKDLYYRLRSHRILVPPLRKRREDIPLLVDHFLIHAAREIGKEPPRLPREIYTLLEAQPFPGNVRELEGLLSDALVRHESGTLSLKHLRRMLEGGSAKDAPVDRSGNPFAGIDALPTMEESSRLLIEEAMVRAKGNQATAAGLIGMSRTALNRRLKR